jgi:hypothetical protein
VEVKLENIKTVELGVNNWSAVGINPNILKIDINICIIFAGCGIENVHFRQVTSIIAATTVIRSIVGRCRLALQALIYCVAG